MIKKPTSENTEVVKESAEKAAKAEPAKVHEHHVEKDLYQKAAFERTLADRLEAGKKLRFYCPRESHSELPIKSDRFDPIDLLIESGKHRIQELLPIRYGRMSLSPFAFYRGAAAIMAADLSNTPSTGYLVQACGDCHLSNFGAFGTAEGRVIFDINDFDETFRAPWEWDLKRLTSSFVIACQNNGYKVEDTIAIVKKVVKSYTKKMRKLSKLPVLEAWSQFIDYESLVEKYKDKNLRKLSKKKLAKAESVSGLTEMVKLGHIVQDQPVIKEILPLIYHADVQQHPDFLKHAMHGLERYKKTLPIERRVMFDRYELSDFAMKVVGVGSVGTYCAIGLFFAGENDPLFLQIKEAGQSVLEPYVPKHHKFESNGQRVVYGQRIMQVAGDVFLGYFKSEMTDRHFYIRKLHDVKVKIEVETFTPQDMKDFARNCGWALALAHTRSCDPAVIAGYIGKSDEFAEAITQFSFAYADLNQRDHQQLINAIKAGKVPTASVLD